MLSTQQLILNGRSEAMLNQRGNQELVVDAQYHSGFEGLPVSFASNWLPPVPGTKKETVKRIKVKIQAGLHNYMYLTGNIPEGKCLLIERAAKDRGTGKQKNIVHH